MSRLMICFVSMHRKVSVKQASMLICTRHLGEMDLVSGVQRLPPKVELKVGLEYIDNVTVASLLIELDGTTNTINQAQ
jgi:hypothetical protein